MTADILIHDLDALTHELRRVAVEMIGDPLHPNASGLFDHAEELYLSAAVIDEWIAEMVGAEGAGK